jgi:hypothetical protein
MKNRNAKQYQLNAQRRLNLFITLFTNNAFAGFKIEKIKDEESGELKALTLYCKNVDVADVYKIAEITRVHVFIREIVLQDIIGHGICNFTQFSIS